MLSDPFQDIQSRSRADGENEWIRAQEQGRLASLLPLCRERMAASPCSYAARLDARYALSGAGQVELVFRAFLHADN